MDRKNKNCGACGKFLSAADAVKCTKCPSTYHRGCVALPSGATVAATWLCPGCKLKIPREDNSTTPVKGITTTYTERQEQEPGARSSSTADERNLTKSDVDGLTAEIRGFREELSAVRADIRDLRAEVSGFQSSLKVCTDRIENVEVRLVALESKFEDRTPPNVDALEDTICTLRQELNVRDQELLLNDVDIAGVPECPDDNLVHIVKLLAIKVGHEVQECDIVHVERVGPLIRNLTEKGGTGAPRADALPRPRNIVVRFARRITRDQLLRAARVRRTITSTDLELEGAPRRLYVNERLTRTNRRLFAITREAARRAHYKYTWTREGKIFVRKEDGRTAERVRCEKDIVKIFGSNPV